MRKFLKTAVEASLIGTGAERILRRRRRGETLILAYHNILPPGCEATGERSLHLPHHDFVRQLDAIQQTHRVTPLESVLAGDYADTPQIAITFDDAYAGALEFGIGELSRRRMPATVFVAPGLLAGTTWWDVFADPATGVVNPQLRRQTLDESAGIVKGVAPTSGTGQSGNLQRIGTERQLASASQLPGITFGSHTWSHPDLTKLAPGDLAQELSKPMAWLRERFDCTIPWLSYPYGHFNSLVADAAATAGYAAALQISGGWMNRDSPIDRHRLPRYNVPAGLSLAGFKLRLAGLGTTR
ncbi:MAG: polysaccharide deacetylase family protein [Gemmatimonadaceae bacterium]